MAPKVDEIGVEYDEEIEKALGDPKSGTLSKVLDYFLRRKEKQAEIEAEKKKKEIKPGPFGNIFG